MTIGPYLSNPKILIVDDDPTNILLLQAMLKRGGYERLTSAGSGRDAIALAAEQEFDLVLLDLHMPDLDGYDVLRSLREAKAGRTYLPILVFTADATTPARTRALELGASDFLTKPGDATEILLRIRNFLLTRALHLELAERNFSLEQKVLERTKELESSQVEVIERLAVAGEFRDTETGDHTRRVGDMSGKIAHQLGLPSRFVNLIRLAARLHDLGKVAIPDEILLKKGKLTDAEYAVMKDHCQYGSQILANGSTPLVQMAERIAIAHHERFDGSGYPMGLVGDAIPVEARIVAVADVYDVLITKRTYKEAWDHPSATQEIEAQSGRHFDPKVVKAFQRVAKSEQC